MQVMSVLPQEDLRGIERSTQASELTGYNQFSGMENLYGPPLPLGIAAAASKTLNIGTAVAVAFPRSPMVSAEANL